MTFQEILEAAYDDQGYQISGVISPNPSSDVIARFKRWTNEAMHDIMGRPRLAPLRHGSVPFWSDAGQTTYAVPDAFDAIDTIVQHANDIRLRAMTRDQYRSIDPGERSSGTPYAWIEEGYAPVMLQPGNLYPHGTVETPVWVVSTQAADTTQTVHISGAASDGQLYGDLAVSLNGLTRVQVGYPETWWVIESFFVDAPTDGNIELWTQAVGGLRIAVIVPPRTSVQYHMIRLWPTPTDHLLYTVDGQLKVPPLVEPNDVPFQIPRLYHQALVDYVNYRAYEKNGDSARSAVCRGNYERRIGELCNKTEFSADYRPVKGALGPESARWNNLGSWYPADGWGRW
jgi:hypothetical protein